MVNGPTCIAYITTNYYAIYIIALFNSSKQWCNRGWGCWCRGITCTPRFLSSFPHLIDISKHFCEFNSVHHFVVITLCWSNVPPASTTLRKQRLQLTGHATRRDTPLSILLDKKTTNLHLCTYANLPTATLWWPEDGWYWIEPTLTRHSERRTMETNHSNVATEKTHKCSGVTMMMKTEKASHLMN